MRLPSNAHVAIVDGENFTVMRNTGQPLEPKLGSAEKPDLSATNYSAGVKHQDNAGQQLGRTDLEELAHGAAATEWLNAKAIDASDCQAAQFFKQFVAYICQRRQRSKARPRM